MSAKDERRWSLAAEHIRTLDKQPCEVDKDWWFKSIIFDENLYKRYLNHRRLNFESVFSSLTDNSMKSGGGSVILFLALVLLSAMYGAVHLSAKDFEFASPFERTLWMAACYILLGGSGLVLIIGGAFLIGLEEAIDYIEDGIDQRRDFYTEDGQQQRESVRRLYSLASWVFNVTIILLYRFLLLAASLSIYIAARIYIVVEAFISLRHVPLGVYATPSWTNYIPHL